MKEFEVGDLVKSLRGRDSGRVFCVISRPNEDFAIIADGRYRRLANPKLKKLKHLQKVAIVNGNLAEKLRTGAVVFDGELNRAIRERLADDKGN